MSAAFGGRSIAVVVSREGRLPEGAPDAAAEAGGRVLVVGTGADAAAGLLGGAAEVWWWKTEAGPAALARMLAPVLEPAALVVLPASPDGRDLAPRLAAELGWPLLAGAIRVAARDGEVDADLLRVDGKVVVPVRSQGAAVATLIPGSRGLVEVGPARGAVPASLELGAAGEGAPDPEVLAVVEPDPATMDLADATRVLAGGAGLVPRGADDSGARAVFTMLGSVAAAIGASPGATRVVTDAGWMPYDRQIGTTGVTVSPDLYLAMGVSGASQHVGGIGNPRHTVSVNTDSSSPMTAMADLGLVTDALGLLAELADRLGVDVPGDVTALVDVPWETARG